MSIMINMVGGGIGNCNLGRSLNSRPYKFLTGLPSICEVRAVLGFHFSVLERTMHHFSMPSWLRLEFR